MTFAFVPFGTLYSEPVRNGLTRPTAVRGDGYRMVNMGELFAYERIGEQLMERVQLNERELQVATLEIGDLLFARSSLKADGTGKCSIVHSLPEVTTFESHLIRARLDRSKADPSFYFYFFQSYYGRATVLSIAKQVGAAGLPGSKLAGLSVPHPNPTVQKRIVDILSVYDDLIENNRRRMVLLEEVMRHIYREWFVLLRFPGYEHTPLANGLPQGWETKVLGDVLTLKRGYDLPEEKRCEGNVPIVSSSGVTGYHNEMRATAPGVVTGRYGTLGEVFFIQEAFWPLNTSLYVCDFKGSPPAFVAYLLRNVLAGIQSDKAAVPGLDRNVVHRMQVVVPPNRLREQFADYASLVLRQALTLENSSRKLRAARDVLLPRLLSGEIAV